MNIYEQLGAKTIDFGDPDIFPSVYRDGSTDEKTKLWAIKKLGFNDQRVIYTSWKETYPTRCNVVPFSAEIENVKCYLYPLSKIRSASYASMRSMKR